MISMDKKYKDSTGPVELLCVDAAGITPIAYLDCNKILRTVDRNGRFQLAKIGSDLDLIEITPYDFPIGAKVIVWNNNERQYKRYFAGVHEDGSPQAFMGGLTSWTTDGDHKIRFDHCELAE